VLFRGLLSAAAASQLGNNFIVRGALQFIEIALGGALVGLGMAGMMSLLLKLTSRSVASQLGVTVVAAYLSFIIADPMFQALPPSALQKIADFSRSVVVEAGGVVVREGEEGHSFFAVTAGLLEVPLSGESGEEGRPRLFAGDFFGEMSLLFNQPRNATVLAVMTTELLELDQPTFEFILKEYPLVRAQIYQTAQARGSSGADETSPG
jgi:hypothetical protein